MQAASAILNFVYQLPRRLLIVLVRFYQLVLSPHIGAACRFQPTCSHYSIEALTKYGAFRGTILTIYRIGRCHPWGGHGFDPPRWFGEEPEEKTPAERDVTEQADPVSRKLR